MAQPQHDTRGERVAVATAVAGERSRGGGGIARIPPNEAREPAWGKGPVRPSSRARASPPKAKVGIRGGGGGGDLGGMLLLEERVEPVMREVEVALRRQQHVSPPAGREDAREAGSSSPRRGSGGDHHGVLIILVVGPRPRQRKGKGKGRGEGMGVGVVRVGVRGVGGLPVKGGIAEGRLPRHREQRSALGHACSRVGLRRWCEIRIGIGLVALGGRSIGKGEGGVSPTSHEKRGARRREAKPPRSWAEGRRGQQSRSPSCPTASACSGAQSLSRPAAAGRKGSKEKTGGGNEYGCS